MGGESFNKFKNNIINLLNKDSSFIIKNPKFSMIVLIVWAINFLTENIVCLSNKIVDSMGNESLTKGNIFSFSLVSKIDLKIFMAANLITPLSDEMLFL